MRKQDYCFKVIIELWQERAPKLNIMQKESKIFIETMDFIQEQLISLSYNKDRYMRIVDV